MYNVITNYYLNNWILIFIYFDRHHSHNHNRFYPRIVIVVVIVIISIFVVLPHTVTIYYVTKKWWDFYWPHKHAILICPGPTACNRKIKYQVYYYVGPRMCAAEGWPCRKLDNKSWVECCRGGDKVEERPPSPSYSSYSVCRVRHTRSEMRYIQSCIIFIIFSPLSPVFLLRFVGKRFDRTGPRDSTPLVRLLTTQTWIVCLYYFILLLIFFFCTIVNLLFSRLERSGGFSFRILCEKPPDRFFDNKSTEQ